MDSDSDKEHLYESLSFDSPAKNSPKRENFSDDDTDSFDSNSETEREQVNFTFVQQIFKDFLHVECT